MTAPTDKGYGLRRGAEECPFMVVIAGIYPSNFGRPMCPYTDGNSDIRQFYKKNDGDLIPVKLWEEHGWPKVLKTSGDHLKEVMKRDLGVEVEIYQPKA
jgi:hypothetical protein